MPNDFYCGVKTDNLKRRRGSMKECIEANEIRYYGFKLVDQDLFENINSMKKQATSDKVWIKLVGVRAAIKRLERDIPFIKDKNKKKEMMKELDKAIMSRKKLITTFKELKKMEEEKTLEKEKNKIKAKSLKKEQSKSTKKEQSKPTKKEQSKPTKKEQSKPTKKEQSKTINKNKK